MSERSSKQVRALGQRAAELAQAGRNTEALAAWEAAYRLAPGTASVAAGLGAALLGVGRVETAAQFLAEACRRHPGELLLLRLHARALVKQRQYGPALGALYVALSLKPDAPETHADLAEALYANRASANGLPHALAAYGVAPTVETTATLVNILLDLGRAEDAIAVIDGAVSCGADRGLLSVGRSLALEKLGRHEEALRDARIAMALAPMNAYCRHNLAAMLLLRGHLGEEAWSLYESRIALLDLPNWPQAERRWAGEDLTGRTVLVHAEQGLGDTLQFVRYVPMLAARGARVVVAVQAPLVRLLQGLEGAESVIAAGSALPPFDVYIPLLSLPGLFATTLETIPPPARLPLVEALSSPAEPTGAPAGLQVGLVWAGNAYYFNDRKRSLDPSVLAPLGEVRGVVFHSLQLGCTEMPLPTMRDAMAGVTDFADTGSRIAGLDLVIAVDTAVAHLAATMGKPVWLLSRAHGCWRWLMDRTDTPWYPTVRIYRQPPSGEWPELIAQVRNDLAAMAAGADRLAA